MLETYLRPSYQKFLLDPIAQILVQNSWLTANRITYLAAIFGLLVPIVLYFDLNYLAVSCLLLSGLCDTLDGTFARLQELTSPLGSMLDIVFDRVVEFAVLFGLYIINPGTRATTTIILLGSILICVTSFLVVGLFSENRSNKGFHYSPGLVERAEAFIFFGLMILLPTWYNVLASILSLLILYTAVQRCYVFAKQV